MKKERIALYKTLLFTLPSTTPELKTYAIVDSARDESLREKVLLSGLNFVDLWHEEMFELEQERPLYLVALKEDNMLLNTLLAQHQESVATYFISPYNLETLQSYYSPFTYVQIEETQGVHEKALFGFYDPNILPNYIQTLHNEEKVDEFFAGIGMWLSPSVENGEELYLAFRTKEGNIEDVNIKLSAFTQEEKPMLDFEDVSLPTEPNLEAYVHEVSIDYTQMQLFDALEKRKFAKKLLTEYGEENYSFLGEGKDFIMQIIALMDEGNNAGIQSEGGIYYYVLLRFLFSKNLSSTAIYDRLKSIEHEEEKIAIIKQMIYQLKKERREDHGQ